MPTLIEVAVAISKGFGETTSMEEWSEDQRADYTSAAEEVLKLFPDLNETDDDDDYLFDPTASTAESMEQVEDWMVEVDLKNAKELLDQWQESPAGAFSGDAAWTKYFVKRLYDLSKENPAEWKKATEALGITDFF
mgnify:CR=1 FL=1